MISALLDLAYGTLLALHRMMLIDAFEWAASLLSILGAYLRRSFWTAASLAVAPWGQSRHDRWRSLIATTRLDVAPLAARITPSRIIKMMSTAKV